MKTRKIITESIDLLLFCCYNQIISRKYAHSQNFILFKSMKRVAARDVFILYTQEDLCRVRICWWRS